MGSDRVSRQIDLRNAFKQWDLKKCGGLDEEEFQALRELRMHSRRDCVFARAFEGALASLGFDATPEVTAAVFKAPPAYCKPSEAKMPVEAFDLKGDGRVSCWEFTRGLHNLQAGEPRGPCLAPGPGTARTL